MNTEIRVLIADDHPLMRSGVRQSIESAPGITVVAEAGDGSAALQMILQGKAQIAVLDISMPVMDGFQVLREIRKQKLPVEVIFLTAQSDEALFQEAVSLGVKAYVLKESAASDIVAAIRAVAAGEHYTSPALTTYLMRRQQAPQDRAGSLADLTATEMRVLRLVAEYKTTREIAEALFISPLTAETHRRNICEKLGLRGSNALVKFALSRRTELL